MNPNDDSLDAASYILGPNPGFDSSRLSGSPEASESGGSLSPSQALDGLWKALERYPHQFIRPDLMAITGRAAILRDHLMETGIWFDNGDTVAAGKEVAVIAVGGQGLQPFERSLCHRAGQRMAEIFTWEANQGQNPIEPTTQD